MKLHLDEAIEQRRIWANFVCDYVGKTDPNLKLDPESFPLVMEDLDNNNLGVRDLFLSNNEAGELPRFDNLKIGESGDHEDSKSDQLDPTNPMEEKEHEVVAEDDNVACKRLSGVSLQAEDYGGGLALPHYGFRRPSADYFNSNLMSYNFVVADITGDINNVFSYDERDQGKGADALCSMRMRYHLRKMQQYWEESVTPKLNMTLLDNCVGQNKSQLVMKFCCLLSVIFYETVALMFFLPGHTHMLPDRVFGQCKNSIKGLNLYTLAQITERFNSVKGVNAEWLRGDDSDRPFRVGWGSILNKYFKDIPGGYTKFYFFEFTGGYLTYRRLANSPDSDAISLQLIDLKPGVKEKLLVELFGKTDVENLRMTDLNLPKNQGKVLGDKKLKSLSEKYFSIPDGYKKYYPKYVKPIKKKIKPNNSILASAKRKLVAKNNTTSKSNSKKRKVGRPKIQPKIPEGIRSITTYFRANK